ncbi:MAG: fibronectin type III domain-containing protein, partial [Proteobacteria bacterium]|nr:fibronectin type III domain-containing protein [Pseudomonadota bacterium]
GDVDGADLAYSISHITALDAASLAAEFGRQDCDFQTTIPPVISNISVTAVSGQSATINWTTDQPATSRVDYGTTATYGFTAADTALVEEHSILLTDLLSGTTYHFQITSANAAGLASLSTDETFETLSVMSISITSPAEGETITSSYLLVQGTVAGTTEEVGITANGVAALIDNGQFAANRVPLMTGANTITVMAVDMEGNVALATINVTCQPATDFIELIPNAESGIAPFTANFSITATFDMASATTEVSAVGPAAMDSVTFTDSEHFTTMLSVPGLYLVTAQVTDSASTVYTDSAAILVMDKDALDGLLKGKWNGMKTALAAGNIEGGIQYFVNLSKDRYRQIFTALADKLPQTVQAMEEIEMIYYADGIAKYRINRTHDIDGAPVTITYYIYFERDRNGLFKIYQF